MSDIILILSILYGLKALLTTSLIPDKWIGIGFSLLCGVFVWYSHGFALEQNKLTLETGLEGQKILTDVFLVVMVDLMLTLGFCISILKRSINEKENWANRMLGFIPPLMMLPLLYYIQVNMFFTFVGVDFNLLTSILCGAAVIFMLSGTYLTKYVLPGTAFRIELTALLELLIFILVICCTIFHPSALIYTDDTPLDYRSLLLTIGVVVVFFTVGFIWNKLKLRIKRKKIIIMEQISNVLFWISGGLLVPVILGLIWFFVRSMLMLGNFCGSYVTRVRREKNRTEWIDSLSQTGKPTMDSRFESLSETPFTKTVRCMLSEDYNEAVINRTISDYEITSDKELGKYKLLVKMGPILGLMGTLIPMGPALAGLASGDISSMAYNMQVAFATTVIGLFVGAVGFILAQIKQRWINTDMVQLDYIAELYSQNHGASDKEE